MTDLTERLREMPCGNPQCTDGAIPHGPNSDGSWEAEQCQICDYIREAAAEIERLRELAENDAKEIGSYRDLTGLRGYWKLTQPVIDAARKCVDAYYGGPYPGGDTQRANAMLASVQRALDAYDNGVKRDLGQEILDGIEDCRDQAKGVSDD